MIYAFISLAILVIGTIIVFIGVNSNHNKEIHINNQKLDKMFEFLRDDIIVLQKKIKDLEEKDNILEQVDKVHSQRIEKSENEIKQLRTGSNSRFY